MSAVVARARTTCKVDGKEVTPGQLLERLGFTSARLLDARCATSSGGQRRRLRLLLILLDEPNVLILDEPTNDLDTDMLAAMEDLLDSFAGDADRGEPRPVPARAGDGSAVRDPRAAAAPSAAGWTSTWSSPVIERSRDPRGGGLDSARPAVNASGAERRTLEKELAATERRIAKLTELVADVHDRMAVADQSDFAHLQRAHGRGIPPSSPTSRPRKLAGSSWETNSNNASLTIVCDAQYGVTHGD